MLTVNHFELIRRKILVEGMSQREAAKELGHSRKTIKKALEHPAPVPYQLQKERSKPVLESVRHVIDAWLSEDQQRPKKQRHTAQRIFERLQEDPYHFRGSYSTVRRYVAQWKANAQKAEVFVPLVFAPGEEAQVDWGQAQALFGGRPRKVQLFCMKLAYSKRVFVRAYWRAHLEAFLDGHVRAFAFFGGVPGRLAYDNLKTAVIRVGRGRERTLHERFLHLRSWYLFDSRFCNPAKGNEKGHVENLVQRSQRTFLTPLPEVADLDPLNRLLIEGCERELARSTPDGQSYQALWEQESAALRSLTAQPFPACVQIDTRADKQSLVRFDNSWYSVPVRCAHQRCQVRGFVDRVVIYCQQEPVAEHLRRHTPECYALNPWHYVPLLERKPGALANGRPFAEGSLGTDFDLLRRELEYRQGESGTRQFIRILLLTNEHPLERVQQAVSRCVRRRAFDEQSILHVLRDEPVEPAWSPLDLSDRPELSLTGDGARSLSIYDSLLDNNESADNQPAEPACDQPAQPQDASEVHSGP